jgi:hypothetical protein
VSTGLFVFLALLPIPLSVGFRWPAWWIALIPIVIAVLLTAYTVLNSDWGPTPGGDNVGALEFLGIVALALVAELALFAGALGRGQYERARGRRGRSRQATRGGAGILTTVCLFALPVAVLIDGRVIGPIVLLASAVLAAIWLIRLRRNGG